MTQPSNTPTRPLWQRLFIRRLKFLLIVAVILGVGLGGSYLFAPQWLMRANTMREAMAAHVEKHAVQAGDTRWSYYEGGEGPTLVLLHGFAANKEVWMDVAKQLTPHFHVIIPDLPGWGESSRNDGASYSVDAQASRLQSFVDALRLQRFVLVGHSLGGAIAGVYSADHPEHVAELALVDSFGLKVDENDFSRTVMAGKNPFLFDDRAGFDRAAALAFAKAPSPPSRFVDVLIKENQRDRSFIERNLSELREPSQYLAVQSRLDRLTMPVMGLWCHADKITDISALDSLRNGLSHSSAISSSILNGCNHMPMLEKTDETARILTGFALSH
ncbi:alpha/beta fold hydrolase [Dyella tabacisoli]|uniref:Alpha/beta hydrolase n=1 Tax=Dyella tabacisoli TaxID=2282381 RepID=A0A369URC3_9GAMM|nr:alpha/beta hydrolase [Dyella tabacisoli]RDD82288.1 alpha/beta hydrolase [Dyella tabacisoli]